MHYGVSIPNFGEFGDPTLLVDLAVTAEAAGWDGIFLWDHMKVFADQSPPVVDPWVVMGAMAQATSHIKLGPMVTPTPRRRIQKLARETTTLDHLSDGRLILGVGIGTPSDTEFAHFGDQPDPRARGQMLDEGLEVLTGLWSGAGFAYDGEHYQIAETTFKPTPVQQPRIPIWVAGFWPNRPPLRRAARWDGVFPMAPGEMTPETLGEIVAYTRQHRTTADPFDVVIARSIPTDAAEAEDLGGRYAEIGLTWWLESVDWPPNLDLASWHERIAAGPSAAA